MHSGTHCDMQALQVQQGEQQVQALVGKATPKAEVLQAPQVPSAQQGPNKVEAAHSQLAQATTGCHCNQALGQQDQHQQKHKPISSHSS